MGDPTSGDPDRAGRFRAQLLTGPPATSVLRVVERLLAVQAQDPRGFRLAVRARSRGLSAADVERALTVDRSVVVTWANRGTLHLVTAEDHSWLHALTTPQLRVTNARRLAQEGVSPDAAVRGVRAIERALAADGPLTRAELRERVAAAGVRVEGQAFVHVVFQAGIDGVAVRGPVVDGEHAHVLTRDWLGAPPAPLDRTVALTLLAERYLAGHGPASDRDLARWAGIGLGEVRRGLAGLGRACATSATGSSTSRAGSLGRPPHRRRCCSGPSTRCCSAGPHGSGCSTGRTGSSPRTGSSGRSPWSTGELQAPGRCRAVRWRSPRSSRCPSLPRRRWPSRPPTSSGSSPVPQALTLAGGRANPRLRTRR